MRTIVIGIYSKGELVASRYPSARQMSMPKPVCPNMATTTPLGPPGAPDWPQTARQQHAGLLKLDTQPSAARIRLPEGAARKVSASVAASLHSGHLRGIGPEPGTWKDPADHLVLRAHR